MSADSQESAAWDAVRRDMEAAIYKQSDAEDMTMSADSGTPRTDKVFNLIALSNHSECDIEHHRQFLEEARAEIVRMEREADALAAALRTLIREVEFLIDERTLPFAAGSHPSMIQAHNTLAAHGGKP